jgi:hypothetical protein
VTTAHAEFLGWQYFENKKGWKPLFRLFTDPPTLYNGTTATQETLERAGVDIPYVPQLKPDTQRKEVWFYTCSCSLVFTEKNAMIEHIKETKTHKYAMEQFTVADMDDTGKPTTSEVIMLDKVETPVEIFVSAEPVKEVVVEKPQLSEWAQSMYKKFNIPTPGVSK